ncbi:MAG: thymidine kinase [Candidatus Cloacimonetes bacterium]|nr:thymidine kinase [Candidatus Cloacimonadota bacterium]MBL7086225.1 thymidine kinase [Candidatus Cloacimonadota bacterium]
MNIVRRKTGWIEVICGSMFSGKTEELIRRLRRAEIAKQKLQTFKPIIDKRYSKKYIVSHDKSKMISQSVKNSEDLYKKVRSDTEVIGIDECQFFDKELPETCNKLADEGKRVIVAGLDQDYLGRPFHPLPELLAIAEYITKTLAICVKCGNPANRTQRLVKSNKEILLGAKDIYEARCRNCFKPIKD